MGSKLVLINQGLCTKDDSEYNYSQLDKSKIKLSRCLDEIKIEVVQGDILKEKQDLIIYATFQSENPQILKDLSSQMDRGRFISIQNDMEQSSKLNNIKVVQGDILSIKLPVSCQCSKIILAICLPSFKNQVDYSIINEIYKKCFQKILLLGQEYVSYVDSTQANSKFPRQFNAEILIRQALKQNNIERYQNRMLSMENNPVKMFRIININAGTSNLYTQEMEKQIDEMNNPEFLRRLRETRLMEGAMNSVEDTESPLTAFDQKMHIKYQL